MEGAQRRLFLPCTCVLSRQLLNIPCHPEPPLPCRPALLPCCLQTMQRQDEIQKELEEVGEDMDKMSKVG
jgi:hypothetical protein